MSPRRRRRRKAAPHKPKPRKPRAHDRVRRGLAKVIELASGTDDPEIRGAVIYLQQLLQWEERERWHHKQPKPKPLGEVIHTR